MEHGRDEEAEEVLGDIILAGGDILSYLNDNDGLEEQGEEAGYGDRTMEEEGRDYDGSVDRMSVEEGHRDDGSGHVYILIKPVLTRCIHCFGMHTY